MSLFQKITQADIFMHLLASSYVYTYFVSKTISLINIK